MAAGSRNFLDLWDHSERQAHQVRGLRKPHAAVWHPAEGLVSHCSLLPLSCTFQIYTLKQPIGRTTGGSSVTVSVAQGL